VTAGSPLSDEIVDGGTHIAEVQHALEAFFVGHIEYCVE
jgi:hypothetical protein